ncbi:hypothetical protein CDO51_13295 [Natranaerobius trueperi]|uniref:Uncharacterized protein n=1 Tax=Natranaerobius trueperi TaxID=759412 RepID=A0A226BWN7_9FIRM|nr:hypothetical protein CDO51_13295 [Natranaerobius trueperi]
MQNLGLTNRNHIQGICRADKCAEQHKKSDTTRALRCKCGRYMRGKLPFLTGEVLRGLPTRGFNQQPTATNRAVMHG